jgi:hypothetical protein
MVLIDNEAETKAVKEFSIEIRLLPRASEVSISTKYHPSDKHTDNQAGVRDYFPQTERLT